MSHEDLSQSQRLVKYGFFKESARGKYTYDSKQGCWVPKNTEKGYDGSDANQEYHEEATVLPGHLGSGNTYTPTGYPDTVKKYRLFYKSTSASLEETYYWILDHFKVDGGLSHFDKIVDAFSASEQSAFWGQAQSRLSIQQERASGYFATVGKMLKDLFQLVRELRILEERLDIYQKAPESKSADITLKGLYIDLVEGGSKNPGSVYGIAQQVGFTILPDLFFNTHVFDEKKVDEVVSAMKWNKQVKNVLRRKLFALINWKKRTEDELKSRFAFTLKYLRQHWGIIKMYMTWIKPYLRNVKRMQMQEHHIHHERMISAFETSFTEIEVLAKKPKRKDGLWPCILLSMEYITEPEMSYHQEGYQHKGPLHVGEIEFNLRAYAWTDEEIEGFRKLKEEEDMELMKLIDESVAAAMDALGDELQKYLNMAGEKLEKFGIYLDKKEKGGKRNGASFAGSVFDPFVSVVRGFGDLFSLFKININSGKKKNSYERPDPGKRKKATKEVLLDMYLAYRNYKKAHDMIHW